MEHHFKSKDALRALYRKTAVVDGEDFLLSLQQALSFVSDCEKNDLAVLGVEGFTYHPPEIRSVIDLIRDYGKLSFQTWQEFRGGCNGAATMFLRGLLDEPKVLIFSIQVWSEMDWSARRAR